MVKLCYLRLYLGIEIVSCRLLLRMTKMEMDWNFNFFKFESFANKITKKALWLLLPNET